MSYDADAQAYFNAVEMADAQTLEPGVKSAINSFVVGCKADGIWSAIKAACVMAGARTLAGALVPLVGPAPTNFNFVSGDYDRETGLAGNGSTKYLDSNRNNNADPQNNRHLAVWRTTSETRDATRGALSSPGGTGGSSLLTTTTQRFYRVSDSSVGRSDVSTASGFWGASRTGSTDKVERFNGVNNNRTDASQTPQTFSIQVFARNNTDFSNARMSWYSIGESLDLALLDARLSTLMTTLANPSTYLAAVRAIDFDGGYSRMLGGYRG